MIRKYSQARAHKDLIRRYLLWFYKTTKESFERTERKTTQLIVDEFVLEHIKSSGRGVPALAKGKYDRLVKEFEIYIKTKMDDELKLKYSGANKETLHPQYIYLKNKLEAIEAAIRHFLGEKDLKVMKSLYEKEFSSRILQAREH